MTVPMIGLIKMLLSRFPTPQVLLYSLLLNLSIVFGFWVSSSPVSKRRKPRLPPRFFGGDGGIRTHDLGLFLRIQILINDQIMIVIKPNACYAANGLLRQLATDLNIVSFV